MSKMADATRNCSNYLRKGINIQSMLNEYRTQINGKYPEPKKVVKEEVPEPTAAKVKDKKGAAKTMTKTPSKTPIQIASPPEE